MITRMTRNHDDADFPFTATEDGFTAVLSRDGWLDAWSRMARQELPTNYYYQHKETARALTVELVHLEQTNEQ